MENRTKENLLPIITKNACTHEYEGDIDLRTSIYSDCFASYRENDFSNMDFVLHCVNHSVCFGQGRFHTNTIKGLWVCLKNLPNNFWFKF